MYKCVVTPTPSTQTPYVKRKSRLPENYRSEGYNKQKMNTKIVIVSEPLHVSISIAKMERKTLVVKNFPLLICKRM